ncbi:hypothetical protein [Sphingobacterium yanglingense]|uniref:Uncharacterized protein n=1 Tax=Sphingobacterium yanglingense TaxID=1437280 RepID=A0A4R6WK61_9SPHI|nr:hypothetical protein [Sphingobacterium yanglingense]TDQ79092.1 hypothetical protein CLV99_0524 [Sphingobacterium yanglingense]
MKPSEIMKTKFNKFWKGIAVAAILSATAVGYAEASKLQTATHYNATPLDAEDQTPRWEPIVPGSPQDLNPCTSSTRHCKAVQISPGVYNTVAFGYL